MTDKSPEKISLQIRAEVPDITRKWIPIGQVNCHREVLWEEKTISVPLKREELVIEKNLLDSGSLDQSPCTETLRIPLREERLDIQKNTWNLETVNVYKRRIEENQPVELALKKEVLCIRADEDLDMK